jgi:hypothetical protein
MLPRWCLSGYFYAFFFLASPNVFVNNRIPIPEAAETAIRQREGYHEKWDLPKTPTMEKFYAVYPQYRKYPIPQDQYSPGWYYAMQFSGDLESATSSEKLFEKLGQRQRLSETIAGINPVIAAQQLLNKIANTDLTSHIRYLQSVKRTTSSSANIFIHSFSKTRRRKASIGQVTRPTSPILMHGTRSRLVSSRS